MFSHEMEASRRSLSDSFSLPFSSCNCRMGWRSWTSMILFIVFYQSSSLAEKVFIGRGDFSSNNMVLLGDASIDPSGRLSLISETQPKEGAGVGYFHEPIRIMDRVSNTTGSFRVWFRSFQEPEIYRNSSQDRRGDGMTLCFSSDRKWIGGDAAQLGFFAPERERPGSKLVAVEYDTFQNPGFDDPVGDHIGVDVNSPTSRKTVEVSTLRDNITLWEGLRVQINSWVRYNGTSKRLEVKISNSDLEPSVPALTYDVELLNLMNDEMWVGFSAGTGQAHSFYYIEEWEIVTDGLPPILPKKKGDSKVGLILGLVLGIGALMVIVGLIIVFFVRWDRQTFKDDENLLSISGMPDYYSYRQLSAATNKFSESSKLGQGGFGSVYQGVLSSTGMAVAVKKVGSESRQGEREFLAEVSIISQLRHRNIVQLVGWCKTRGKFMLVYELVSRGSLDKALFHPSSPRDVLTWDRRLKILQGLASALHYLHEGWRQQVIHRDVKPSNVMLDDEFNTKLGDFGLARLVDHAKNAATTLVAGTYGYIAPEAPSTGKYTDKTDVFAFGAVVLEVATGRKALDASSNENEVMLVDLVWNHLSTGSILTMADRRLEGNFDATNMEVVLLLGLLCSHPNPKSRPTMRQVVQVLSGDAPVPPVPRTKPSPVFAHEYITVRDLQMRSPTPGASSSDSRSTVVNSSSFVSGASGSSVELDRAAQQSKS